MRIGIDSSRATVVERTGTENYSLRLVRELLEQGNGHEFTLYFREPPAPGAFPERPGVTQQVISFPRLWTHVRLSWEMATNSPDVLFVPAHVLPVVHPPRTVVTVHDLGYLHHKQAHRTVDWYYLHLSTMYNARMASRVIADSDATKRDLIERYEIPADKITTIYLAHDESFHPVDDSEAVARVLAQHGIDSEYFLCLGTLQPRKNLMGAIAAFAAMRRLYSIRHKLVIAGKYGWLAQSIFKKARSLGIEKEIIYTGYVDQCDLPALLTGATALVFVSLYEGFGLPALEAMACGTPVVASDVSSIPEVVGDAGLLVDPRDIGAIASAMGRLAGERDLRQELREKGLQRARLFSWPRCAAETLAVIREVADN